MRRIGIDARKLEDGGIGRYVGELTRRLPRLAAEATFVALARPSAAARLREQGDLEVVEVGSRGYGVGEHVELARVAREQRLDLLHVPHYVVPAAARCPLVVTVHDLIHLRVPRTPLHAVYARCMLALVRRRARLVLAPSRAVAQDLERLARIPAARIVVVPNGVDAGAFGVAPPAAAIDAFRRVRGIDAPYALNVSNGLPHKGLDLLLAAVRDLPELRLVVAGRGSDRPAVRAAVAAAGLPSGRVVLLGELPEAELRLAYRGAALVVVASRLEGFGLPALEAMATGVPVVAADAGALPEVVGDAGILFRAGSVACLREALYRLTPGSNQEERSELVRRGLARAREFTWDRTAQETYAAYERALLCHT
jgi:glycosyltransferase involved in cell wall biosynthesis